MGRAAQRTDGSSAYGPGESFKTGSASKEARLEAYVDWLLTPLEEREPRTKKAFAEQWGVSPEIIRRDTQEPYVQRELASRARQITKVERLPAILDNLYRLATGGGRADLGVGESGAATPANAQVSAAKTLLDWMERTAVIRETDIKWDEMSNDEVMTAVFEFLQRQVDADSS